MWGWQEAEKGGVSTAGVWFSGSAGDTCQLRGMWRQPGGPHWEGDIQPRLEGGEGGGALWACGEESTRQWGSRKIVCKGPEAGGCLGCSGTQQVSVQLLE